MTISTRLRAATWVDDMLIVPNQDDHIEVCWRDADGELVWWEALVVESKPNKKGRVYGVGTIKYKNKEGLYDDPYSVEFVHDKSSGRSLRTVGSSMRFECTWRASTVVSQGHALKSSQRANEGTQEMASDSNESNASDQTFSPTKRSKRSYEQADLGEQSESKQKEPRLNTSPHMPSHGHVGEINHDTIPNKAAHDGNSQHEHPAFPPSALNKAGELFANMISSYSNALIQPSQQQSRSKCHVTVLKTVLKYHLVQRCAALPTIRKAYRTLNEGAYIQPISFSVTCCLDWFVDIVKDIHAFKVDRDFNQISFIPSFHKLINPSRAARTLVIYIPTFNYLCKWLNLREESDISSFLVRRRESSSNPAFRILGGSRSDKTSHETLTHERSSHGIHSSVDDSLSDKSVENNKNHESIDVIADGLPCTTDNDQNEPINVADETCAEKNGEVGNIDDTDEDSTCYDTDKILIGTSSFANQFYSEESSDMMNFVDAKVVQQERLNWDSTESRYIDEWKAKTEKVNVTLNESILKDVIDVERHLDQCFTMTWNRLPQLSGRNISSDATYTNDIILGKLELKLPAVLCVGHNTCAEIEKAIG